MAKLRIVVLDEGDGIAAVFAVFEIGIDEWPAAVVLVAQTAPQTVVSSIAHHILELEVEGGTLDDVFVLRALYPVLDGGRVVPALADGELGLRGGVVLTRKGC